MKVLIAGCNGNVGKGIAKKVVARGLDTRCFDINPLEVQVFIHPLLK